MFGAFACKLACFGTDERNMAFVFNMLTVILFHLHQFIADTMPLFSSSAISAAEVPVTVIVASSAKKSISDLFISRARSLMYRWKSRGPKTDP